MGQSQSIQLNVGVRRRGFAALAALIVGGILAVSVPAVSHAAVPVVSQGEGRLLTAELVNSGIDSLVALNGASAVDPFGLANVTSDVPLDATALGLLNLQVNSVNLFGTGGIIQLGAVGQYAGANNDASSVAFSGTVSDAASLVGAGTVVTGSNVGTPGGSDSARIDVGTNQILGGADLVDLHVGIGAVAASAAQTSGGTQTGDYLLSTLDVTVGGTVLGGTIGTINTALAPVFTALSGLGVTVPNPLASGQLSVSLADLLAVAGVANVNLLPAGTNLLTYLPAAISAKLTSVVNTLLADLNTAVTGLGLAGVAAGILLTAAEAVISPLLATLATTLAGPLGTAVDALLQLDVNNQSTNSGAFTQNALTIGVGTNGALARVGLANATVGPNAGVLGVETTISGLTPTSGPESGGTSVVITGTNFTGATSVLFGSTPAASFTIDSDTQITAVSPPHTPATVGVTVSNPAGPSNPGNFTFTPLISVLTIDPNFGPAAGGTVVTITGTCFTGATGVDFGGIAGTAFTVVDDSTITVSTPAGTGLVDVTVHGTVACGGDTTVTDGFQYILPGAPVMTGITPNSGPDTGGTPVTITGSGFTGATSATFGGVAGTSFVVVNDTTITVVTPPHAVGLVNAEVVHPVNGPSAPLGFTFLPGSTITGVDPGTGPEAGGTSVTITGSCFTGATGVRFGATAATSFQVVTDTTIVAVSPPGTGTVDVTVTGSPSCGTASDVDAFRYIRPGLALTGTEIAQSLIVALLLVLGGLAMVSTRVRRRRPSAGL
jgi:hypothetical protein